jgi:carboxylesterase type B
MLFTTAIAVSSLASLTTFISCQRTDSTPTVTIDSGPVSGQATQLATSETIVNRFLGIPFASPPVNDLRFAPPQQPERWLEVYNATSEPNACMQYNAPGPASGPIAEAQRAYDAFTGLGSLEESEDCLYLNVFAPSGGSRDKAVMFWIYGGSGLSGGISQHIYDGTSFAAHQDIVVVAANYRVNGKGLSRAGRK